MTALPSTYDMFRKGMLRRMEQHDAREKTKVGTLRAGNTGVYIDDATIAGACHRKAVLRFLGVNVPKTAEEQEEWERRQLMFEAGLANEDSWVDVLCQGVLDVTPGIVIKQEDEIPTSWVLKHGNQEITVTGRPDIVLCAEDGRPLRGLELKLISSVYTLIGTLFEGEPKIDHLAQAAHYMMALACPEYEVWYTCRADFHAKEFFKKNPATGKWEVKQDEAWPNGPKHPFAKYVEFSPPQKGKSGYRVKKAQPAMSGYALRFDSDGVLEYMHLTAEAAGAPAPWKKSVVSKDGIVDFYRYVADTARLKDLGPRVSTLRADGQKHRFSSCDYCELFDQCKAGEKAGFEKWVELVKNRAAKA